MCEWFQKKTGRLVLECNSRLVHIILFDWEINLYTWVRCSIHSQCEGMSLWRRNNLLKSSIKLACTSAPSDHNEHSGHPNGHYEALSLNNYLFWQRKEITENLPRLGYCIHTISHIIRIHWLFVILWDWNPQDASPTKIKLFFTEDLRDA